MSHTIALKEVLDVKTGAVALAILGPLLAAGCTDEGVVIEDGGFSLIREVEVTAVPENFTPGSVVNLTVTCIARYPGTGTFEVIGHGGGADVGVLREPEEAAIGTYVGRLDLPAGRLDIPVEILMTTTLQSSGLTFSVRCDSLLVDGVLVGWDSPEGRGVWSGDVPEDTAFIINSGTDYVSIPRAES